MSESLAVRKLSSQLDPEKATGLCKDLSGLKVNVRSPRATLVSTEGEVLCA